MNDFSRRDFCNLLIKGSLGMTFLNLLSCTDSNNDILSSNNFNVVYSDDEVKVAKDLLENYCSNNLYGYYLKELKMKLSKNCGSENLLARDKVVVAEDFKICGSEIREEYLSFHVQYKYFGVIKGETFFVYNPKNGNQKYLTFNFQMFPSNKGFTISKKLPSFCSRNSLKQHFEMLIDLASNKSIYEIRDKGRLGRLKSILDALNYLN